MRIYLCSTSGRRCLVVGEEIAQRCRCGGELTPALLLHGQYELIGQGPGRPHNVRESQSERHEPMTSNPTGLFEQEEDLGYGQSHGYDPGHGGPTGPGDAPAK
jgi:hypothetical protein